MGFNLEPGVSRRDAVAALAPFAFGDARCAYLELRDHQLADSDVAGLGYRLLPWTGIEVDLARSEEEIWAGLKAPCRTAVRKAEKRGRDGRGGHRRGLRRGLLPAAPGRLREAGARAAVRDRPHPRADPARPPTGRLLLLRARDADGTCVATGIFPALEPHDALPRRGEPARAPAPPAERGAHVACDAALEEPRCRGLRPRRARRVQAQVGRARRSTCRSSACRAIAALATMRDAAKQSPLLRQAARGHVRCGLARAIAPRPTRLPRSRRAARAWPRRRRGSSRDRRCARTISRFRPADVCPVELERPLDPVRDRVRAR